MTFMLFAPIPKQTASYYGVTGQKFESYNTLYNNLHWQLSTCIWNIKQTKVNQVDWFFILPMIMNIPIGLCALYFTDLIGLKKSLWICTTCTTIGNFIRSATLFHDGSNYDHCKQNINEPISDKDGVFSMKLGSDFLRLYQIPRYYKITYRVWIETPKKDFPEWYCPSLKWNFYVALFGRTITAISIGFRRCLSTKLTAEWFSPCEYDTVNSLASLADPFGITLAFLIVPFFAKEPSDLFNLQLYTLVPIILSFIGSLFIRQEGFNAEVRDQCLKEQIVALAVHRLLLVFDANYSSNLRRQDLEHYLGRRTQKIIFW